MRAPDECLYCDGTTDCGFCEAGVPLDTQEDWDKSWGSILDRIRAGELPVWIGEG
jgi:hypothetical protein